MSVYQTLLWSPLRSNTKAASFIASGGLLAVSLLSQQQYTTNSHNNTVTTARLLSAVSNDSTSITHKKNLNNNDNSKSSSATQETPPFFDENYFYKPKYPYPAWDHDWDNYQYRNSSISSNNGTSGTTNINDDPLPKKKPTRHIILVRHGQYEQKSSNDEYRVLTEIGRQQAILTGQRIARMMNAITSRNSNESTIPKKRGSEVKSFSGPCYIKSVHVSQMTRAKETANLIVEELNRHNNITADTDIIVTTTTEPDILLNEALPVPMIPHRPDVGTIVEQLKEIHENHDRIESAFQKYFYRPTSTKVPSSTDTISSPDLVVKDVDVVDHEFEIIVCHANIIRYFVMRALQLPPEAWLRLSLYNGSITYLVIQPENGYVTARMIGDTGHIPYNITTFSESYGYNWAGAPSAPASK